MREILYICDFCGKESNDKSDFRVIDNIDICASCYLAQMEWIMIPFFFRTQEDKIRWEDYLINRIKLNLIKG